MRGGACPTTQSVTAYLGLGTNLGDRTQALLAARSALAQLPGLRIRRSAPLYESDPVGVTDQPKFLNTVLEVSTKLGPMQLLKHCKAVEKQGGRRPRQRWGPREIDVDILLYGDWVVAVDQLQVPHPEMRERAFVLVPLMDLAPDLLDPRTRQFLHARIHAFDNEKVTLFKSEF